MRPIFSPTATWSRQSAAAEPTSRWCVGAIAGLCCVLAAAGCGTDWHVPAADRLVVRLSRDPTTLDPAHIVDLDGARIAAKLFQGLVTFDEALRPIPDLARSWTLSPDARTYRFCLRPGVRFFNGREVTAEDFRYSFERVLHPATASPRTWVLSRLRGAGTYMRSGHGHVPGIRVRGPLDLELELEKPFAPFLSLLGLTTAAVVPREEVERLGVDYAFHASGTGPFCLVRWQHNQELVLKRNPFYAGTEPCLGGIQYRVVPEDFTALVSFEKGGLDVLPEIMAAVYDRYCSTPRFRARLTHRRSLNTYYLGLNNCRPPFHDVRVRQALNCAIDREKILRTVLQGRGVPAAGPLPPLLRGGPAPAGYPYDPQRARRLLREAGYPDGFAMTIYLSADPDSLDVCLAIQAYLNAIGVRAGVVQLEWSTFLETVARGEAPAFWLSWWADYPDAENFLYPLFHSANWGAGGNRSRFADSGIDQQIERALEVTDNDARRARYRQIEARIVELAPWVFCWHKDAVSISSPRVRGYRPEPLAVMETGTGMCLAAGPAPELPTGHPRP